MGSSLTLRIYRDGPMQKFGHNHLVTSAGLTGVVLVRDPLVASGFELGLPLESLVVDDPLARERAGGEFAAPVPQKDRDASAPSFSEIVCTKGQDEASLALLEAAWGGSEAVDAEIHFVRTENKKMDVYLKYKLNDVLISGYSLSSGGDRPSESLSLNYSKIEFAQDTCAGQADDVAKAVALYYAVRDSIIYTPYFDYRSDDTYRASTCLSRGWGFCVSKAALLSAAARAAR